MPKNIVICSDGTGNNGNKNRGTNVFKLFEAVDTTGHLVNAGTREQVVFYDDGVGTERARWLRLLTGAVGIGLSRNVRQLYRHLCRTYEPGDSIYLFGFSRGAFTVRTLAGLIVDCGIIDTRDPVPAAGLGPLPVLPFKKGSPTWLRWLSFRALRTHRRHYPALLQKMYAWWLASGDEAVRAFRAAYSTERKTGPVRIHFMGVWDTVNAVGIPTESLRGFWGGLIYRYTFPKTTLSERVEKACHALALDDERHSFTPVLWDESELPELAPCACGGERNRSESKRNATPRIEQVWFPGMHADVGGGYEKHGLAHVPLYWMMRKAELHGLRFADAPRAAIEGRRNALDTMHNSRGGAGLYYRYLPRDVGVLGGKARFRVHSSAFARLLANTDDYAPPFLPGGCEIVTTPGELVNPDLQRVIDAARDQCIRPLRGWVWVRRGAHSAMVVGTVLLAFVLLRTGELTLAQVLALDAGAIWQSLKAGYEAYETEAWGASILAAVAVWAISRLAKGRILSERRSYWRRAIELARASQAGSGSAPAPGTSGSAK